MRPQSIVATCLALVLVGLPSLDRARAAGSARVAFRIRTLVTAGVGVRALTDATVSGPSGTDLTITARTGEFQMTGRLQTDVVGTNRIRIAASFETRRRVGTSERGLALYEMDQQSPSAELALDGSESLVVLPFGRNSSGEELTIEVAPSVDSVGEGMAPSIRIDDPGADGWLRIEARVVPHDFVVEAALLHDGAPVASGSARARLGEQLPVHLSGSDGSVATVDLTVLDYTEACPRGRVEFEFDAAGAQPAPAFARGWAGVAEVAAPASYALDDAGATLPGAPDTLRITVTPLVEEDR